MTKVEKFTFLTAIVGLIADILALSDRARSSYGDTLNLSEKSSASTSLSTLEGFLLFYGWFIISWLIITRYLRSMVVDLKNFTWLLMMVVGAIGILVSPIGFAWISELWILVGPIVWFAIVIAEFLLVPFVCTDIRFFKGNDKHA